MTNEKIQAMLKRQTWTLRKSQFALDVPITVAALFGGFLTTIVLALVLKLPFKPVFLAIEAFVLAIMLGAMVWRYVSAGSLVEANVHKLIIQWRDGAKSEGEKSSRQAQINELGPLGVLALIAEKIDADRKMHAMVAGGLQAGVHSRLTSKGSSGSYDFASRDDVSADNNTGPAMPLYSTNSIADEDGAFDFTGQSGPSVYNGVAGSWCSSDDTFGSH